MKCYIVNMLGGEGEDSWTKIAGVYLKKEDAEHKVSEIRDLHQTIYPPLEEDLYCYILDEMDSNDVGDRYEDYIDFSNPVVQQVLEGRRISKEDWIQSYEYYRMLDNDFTGCIIEEHELIG